MIIPRLPRSRFKGGGVIQPPKNDCEGEARPRGGTPVNLGYVCAAKVLKPWPYLRVENRELIPF